MKKIFAILLVLCFALAGCNNQTNLTSSKELFSSDFSSVHSSSDVSKFESSSNIDASSELAEEVIEEGGACGNIEFHASFESIDEFIQWAKIGGENTDWSFSKSKDNPCSELFLNWRKNKSEIVVPKLKNNKYSLSTISVDHDSLFFLYYINKDATNIQHNRFHIYATPLKEQQKNIKLPQLANQFLSITKVIEEISASKWGKCCIGETSSNVPVVWFVDSSMLYAVYPLNYDKINIADWQEEYFDYFDFETVSLK